MIKRIVATLCFLLIVMLCAGSIVAYCDETPPQIDIKLNPNGSTSMVFNLTLQGGNVSQLAEIYKATFEENGYTVEIDESRNSMQISQDFPQEKGYFLDLSFFGVRNIEFVEFKDLFSTKYGVKTKLFNMEDQEPGTVNYKISIEPPVKAKLSNATVREDKKHTWEITTGEKNEIVLSFKNINIIPLISTLFAFVILLILIIFAFANTKKKQDVDPLYADYTNRNDFSDFQINVSDHDTDSQNQDTEEQKGQFGSSAEASEEQDSDSESNNEGESDL